jgi:hypothetical protein
MRHKIAMHETTLKIKTLVIYISTICFLLTADHDSITLHSEPMGQLGVAIYRSHVIVLKHFVKSPATVFIGNQPTAFKCI